MTEERGEERKRRRRGEKLVATESGSVDLKEKKQYIVDAGQEGAGRKKDEMKTAEVT